MIAEFSLLFVLASALLALPVAGQLRGLAARVATLRQELDAAPLVREVRYTIREVIVARPAAVLPFPARTVPAAASLGDWRKAA